MSTLSAFPAHCSAKRALLSALWYFEIFQYPLTAAELFAYANCIGETPEELAEKLEELVQEGFIYQFGAYYQSVNDAGWVPRRLDYNRRAARYLSVARRMARLMGAFPFIRAVFVSGSLSKNCMAPDGDIDYFLITEPGRLWLARTLLVVFKKLFLFNSHKYFCVNYFIDTEHLEIEDKNQFTATETMTLLPLYGREWSERFTAANGWVKHYLPNLPWRTAGTIPAHQSGVFKKMAERALNGRLGAWLDTQVMRLTVAYWRRKFRHFDEKTFDNALRSRRHVSKHHPLYFQQRVMNAYTARLKELY
ncbi:MAG: nucleotidyltransferase domain-containing protein [Thermoanaerobaculia bacterium]|nr:nucleotidyltransferase domain-containing protein [Thermoanaerobaculia bacterium]